MKQLKLTKEKIGIILVLILSGILNLANLSIENYGNEYYAAGVKSMVLNFKNFFFVSFDPAGFVSIDKPPLGFWIQAISAKIFGFSGWSILLPQALAGIISVALIYYIVKRSFGYTAGIIAAICLAITPVFVAASRNNTIDNLLVLVLLIACVFFSKAAEKGKSKYLIISLIFIGLGFNIKMLEAYMIGPAIYITYLISSAAPLKKRIKHLVIGTVVLIVVSLSWATIVDLVPSQNRPFVGSSTNNTVMELIFGHNGLERLSSSSGGMGGAPGNGTQNHKNFNSKNNTTNSNSMQSTNETEKQNNSNSNNMPPSGNASNKNSNSQNQNMQPPNMTSKNSNGRNSGGMQGGGPGGSGSSNLQGTFGGQTTAGLSRLFSKNILSDQIVWFIPLSILGIIAAVILEKIRFPFNNKKKLDVVFWALWLIPGFIYFSYTKGLFHPYYLTMLAPPIAALSGIGIVSMWKLYKQDGIKSWLLPIAFILEGLVHLLMLSYFVSNMTSTIKAIIIAALILCFVSSFILIIHKIMKKSIMDKTQNVKFARIFTTLALIGILVTPAIGGSAAINHSVNGTIPAGGLELLSKNSSKSNTSMMKRGSQGEGNNQKLIKFLDKNAKTEKYALVVSSANNAGSMIIESGKSVMALGGFSGSDNIISLSEFKQLVKKGEVRYVLTGGMGRSSNSIMSWVEKNGKAVSESEWKDTSSSNNIKEQFTNRSSSKSNNTKTNSSSKQNDKNNSFGGMNDSQTLYDLKGTVK